MKEEILTFCDADIEKLKFHYANIDKILKSNELPFSKKDFKYFIG